MRVARFPALVALVSLTLAACGGGGGGVSGGATQPPSGGGQTPTSVFPVPAQEALTSAEVGTIVAQAVTEARARNLPSVISVVDRVGNVLAVFTMTGARATATADPGPGGNFDVQGVSFPASMGAIAKAVTSAYLSSSGNAFTTRTASEIVQEHFPPAPVATGLESGPLFGVQFSSLPCSDLVARQVSQSAARYVNAVTGAATDGPASLGPKRSPLGLSADPGSAPLYKNGVVVGGIGVMGDGRYGSDKDITDIDQDDEEYIALAGSTGFEAPADIRADRIRIDGTALRFIDATRANLRSTPAGATFAGVAGFGALTSVRGYYFETGTPALLAGTPYGAEASGYRKATAAEFNNPDAFILTNGAGTNRYPARAGTDSPEVAAPLTAAETRAVLEEALIIISRARGAIRQPTDSRMQATVSVVDTRGQVLGVVRSPDAPIFGTDVSLQKARSAAWFSGPYIAGELAANPIADVRATTQRVRDQLGDPTALTGKVAISDRAIGNLARPYFPDGEVGRPPGSLSRSITQFSPFADGLQSALIITNLAEHIFFVQGAGAGGGAPVTTDTAQRCTQNPSVAGSNRIANGIQIFSGSVPIYRGATLVGAIGISGDGIDQDDMVSFLGLYNGGRRSNNSIGHADPAIRSDRVVATLGDGRTVRLRYVNCPFAPFVDTSDQNVCEGI